MTWRLNHGAHPQRAGVGESPAESGLANGPRRARGTASAKYPRRVPALPAENVLAFSLERARFKRVNEGGTADNSLSFLRAGCFCSGPPFHASGFFKEARRAARPGRYKTHSGQDRHERPKRVRRCGCMEAMKRIPERNPISALKYDGSC